MFTFPGDIDNKFLDLDSKPTCVVGLIGKSRAGASSLKTILNCTIPGVQFKDGNDEIQGFYDRSDSILYLYYSTEKLQLSCSGKSSFLENHRRSQDLKLEEIKHWLWLFSVCHLVVVFHPSQSFDVTYMRLFRATTHLLQNLQPRVEETFKGDPLFHQGRIHIPKLLFAFQSNSASMHLPPKKGRHGYNTQCKRLAMEMEKQVFHILRKCRLLPKHHGPRALAYVPSPNDVKEPYVYFMEGKASPSQDYASNKHVDSGLYFISQLSAVAPLYNEVQDDGPHLSSFINRNVAYLRKQGCMAYPEELAGEPLLFHFAKDWFTSASALFKFYCKNDDVYSSTTSLQRIVKQLDPEGQYSESRCEKAYPVAVSAYSDGLPSHYTSTIHERQLHHALRLLQSRAKGPFYETYADRLHTECLRIWKGGRQGCESISLTGNSCILPLHEKDKVHSNRVRMRNSCSCGRSQSYRSDPFDLEMANSGFYHSLAEKCCSTLPLTRVFGRPHLAWMISSLSLASGYQISSGVEQPGFLLGTQFLLPWDIPCDDGHANKLSEPKNAWKHRANRCYIGYEYECSKGHRFFSSVGGVPLKCTAATMLKEGLGLSIINSDAHLYVNCPSHTKDGCRTISPYSKPLLAQLIRLFVCVPEQVTLSLHLVIYYRNILINLTAGEQVHIPGGKMTVIRLPYVYCDENDTPLTFDINGHLKRNPLIPIRSGYGPKGRRNEKKPLN